MPNLPEPVYKKDINLAKILPRSLKNFFWTGISNVLSDELTRLRGLILELSKTYDLNYQTLKSLDSGSIDQFIELAKMFGYDIDLSLENDPFIISELVRSIVSLVKNKTTYISYDIVYSLAKHQGGTFNLYWNGKQLLRATENINNILTDGDVTRISDFPCITEERNYNQFIEGDKLLDLTPPLILDDDVNWYLDQLFSRLTTKHLAFEIYAGSYPVVPSEAQFAPSMYFSFSHFGNDQTNVDYSDVLCYSDYFTRPVWVETVIFEQLGNYRPVFLFDTEGEFTGQPTPISKDTYEFKDGVKLDYVGAESFLDYYNTFIHQATLIFKFKLNSDSDITKYTTIAGIPNKAGLYVINGTLTAFTASSSNYHVFEIGDVTNYHEWTHVYINSQSNRVFINNIEITQTSVQSNTGNMVQYRVHLNKPILPYTGFSMTHEKLSISYQDLYLFAEDQNINVSSIEEVEIVDRFYHAKFPLTSLNFNLIPPDTDASTEYQLMSARYMQYLSNGVNYNRKLTEVPHIGVQVPLFLSQQIISLGNLKTRATTYLTPSYQNNMIPGNTVGEFVVSSKALAVPIGNTLDGEFNRIIITPESTSSTSNNLWHYITTWIQANTVSEKLPHIGDGVQTEFSGRLTYAPIVRNSVKFKFQVDGQAGLVREVIDRFEDPVGFYTEASEQIVSTTKLFAKDAVLNINYACPEENVLENSFSLKFTIDGVLYNILDTVTEVGVLGVFESPYIESSRIDYVNRTVSVTFNRLTDYLENTSISYQFKEFDTSNLDRRAYAELNYETGEYTLFTKYKRKNKEIISTTSLTSVNNYTLSGSFFGPITPGSVKLTYYTTDGVKHSATDVQDPFFPEFGYFTGTNINNNNASQLSNTARIRYTNAGGNVGELFITFYNPTSFVNNVEVEYEYTLLSPIANGTEIIVEYESGKDIPIRSAGITNKQGEFIAYANFPPVTLGSSKFHASFEWFIYRGTEDFY